MKHIIFFAMKFTLVKQWTFYLVSCFPTLVTTPLSCSFTTPLASLLVQMFASLCVEYIIYIFYLPRQLSVIEYSKDSQFPLRRNSFISIGNGYPNILKPLSLALHNAIRESNLGIQPANLSRILRFNKIPLHSSPFQRDRPHSTFLYSLNKSFQKNQSNVRVSNVSMSFLKYGDHCLGYNLANAL